MANIDVHRIEYDDTQAVGVEFPVTVRVENHETVSPAGWEESACNGGSGLVDWAFVDGHRVNVELTIKDATGGIVFEEEQEVCAPPQAITIPNASAEFMPAIDEPGDYVIHAFISVVGANGADSSQPYQLTIEGSTGGLPTGDGGTDTDSGVDEDSGGLPWDGDGSGSGSGLDLGLANADDVMLVVLFIAALYSAGQLFDINLGGSSG